MCSIIIVQKSCLCQVLQRQAQAQALLLNACRALTVAPDGLQAQKRFGRNELVADEGQPLRMLVGSCAQHEGARRINIDPHLSSAWCC